MYFYKNRQTYDPYKRSWVSQMYYEVVKYTEDEWDDVESRETDTIVASYNKRKDRVNFYHPVAELHINPRDIVKFKTGVEYHRSLKATKLNRGLVKHYRAYSSHYNYQIHLKLKVKLGMVKWKGLRPKQ